MKSRPQFKKEIPKSYHDLIEKCWDKDPNERPTFEDIVYYLKIDSSFITEDVRKEDFLKYIDYVESKTNLKTNEKIEENDSCCSEQTNIKSKDIKIHENETPLNLNNNNEHELIIDEFISSNKTKELMSFLNQNCDYEMTSNVFDKCFYKSKEMYINLCQEGILLNNPVAHHKYALFLILNSNEIEKETEKMNNNKQARIHLEESIKQRFTFSYFVHARLCHEVFNQNNSAFASAKEGANKGDKYSKSLLGYFIAYGIGTEKDFKKGISIILNSGAEDYYDIFSTSIALYYSSIEGEESKCFHWFEKAFNLKKTNATINNYGVCFMKGIGVDKNIEKAKEIFEIGVERNDLNSLYHLAFILEESDLKRSLELYKKSADQGYPYSQLRYAEIILETDPNESLKYFKLAFDQGLFKIDLQSSISKFIKEENLIFPMKNYINAAEKGSIDSKEFLVKKYSNENDTENLYKYISSLIKTGNFSVPIEYAINLYRLEHFNQAFHIFSIISTYNHPIAKYYIGVMKYKGQGCQQNQKESFEIMKNLSDQGINRATEFIEDFFK